MVLTVEAMEAMIIMMAILMAMDLGQIDLEVTSVTVLQERQFGGGSTPLRTPGNRTLHPRKDRLTEPLRTALVILSHRPAP